MGPAHQPVKARVIASANGANTAAAGLGYDPSTKRWVFARTAADVAIPQLYKASSKESPVNGAWSHLLATYDAPTGALRLYVNGRLQQETSAPIANAWKATGPLTVGRSFLAGAAGGYFGGSLDHLQIWQRVLRPEEVLELQAPRSSQGPVVTGDAAHWPLDTAVRGQDGIWRSRDTIRGAGFTIAGFQGSDQSKAFVSDAERGKVLELTGARRESVSLGHPVVDASASFSVAVMVKIADPTKPGVIIRQGSSTKDTWRLAYEPDGTTAKFTFARVNADTNTETVATSPIYDGDALDTWHLLVGTYHVDPRDPSNDRIELTMDLRSRDGSQASFAAPTRDGAVVVGKPGPTGTPFAGRLDDIRIYTGDLSPIKACQDYPGLEACGA
ncbi:LamG domain-containing protein [Kribbella sp. NPDC005582]|uniref:LamG domain-containing protein n=1 Tax=Kribbella sp. NPDC005582 TaxID=3156893 RepID=UPI0033A43348